MLTTSTVGAIGAALQALTNSVMATIADIVRIFFINCSRLAVWIATALRNDRLITHDDFPTTPIYIEGSENFKVLFAINESPSAIHPDRTGEAGAINV